MNQTTATLPDDLRVAIVASSWHREIVRNATNAVRGAFERNGWRAEQLTLYEVPGAYEIPLHVQRLARSGRCAAVIACGLVVNGGIYRHEFVAAAVIDALMRVQLDTDVPVFSAVLTPHDFHDHDTHRRFFADHFEHKGREVAEDCLATLSALAALAALPTAHETAG